MRPALTRSTAPASATPMTPHRLTQRQYVRFAFYRVAQAWYRLAKETQYQHKAELQQVIMQFNRLMLLRPYTLVGSRADTDFLLWQIAETPEPFQALATAIRNSAMGGYLTLDHSYLSQTKRSIYEIRGGDEQPEERLIIDPSEARYLYVYPFTKTRAWYQLSPQARQGMMDEHITIGKKYPSIRLNTTYSYGIDDYEFVVAFETDEPADFLDLVQELRESTASLYTLLDTPLYACTNLALDEVLDTLGGPVIAQPQSTPNGMIDWSDVAPVHEFTQTPIKTTYYANKMIAVFKIDNQFYAINNRCSHARGSLSEGVVNAEECSVICPWHYGKFDLRTGQAIDGIVKKSVDIYEVRIHHDIVQIRSTRTEDTK